MSCPITIRFTPQKNEDISDCLPLLAKTGPIMIPLICTCKKAIIRIDSPVVEFGQVIFGEECLRREYREKLPKEYFAKKLLKIYLPKSSKIAKNRQINIAKRINFLKLY